jgi:beta-glucanase (GH16 family)
MPFQPLLRTMLRCTLLLGATAFAAASAQRPRRAPPGWTHVWSDEFNGAIIDTTRWDFDLGNSFTTDSGRTVVTGWGNDEKQCYTRDTANAFVAGGVLHIRAMRSALTGCPFTSARLKTRHRSGRALFAQRYGRFEFRARLPLGRGLWPGLWMLPAEDRYGTWAASGEIDVMEARGQHPDTVLGTLHYGARWPHNTYKGADYALPNGGSINDFHVYALEWSPGEIRWLVDGVAYQTQRAWWSSSITNGMAGAKPQSASDLNPWPAPFDQAFYLIMNLAVGGRFLGDPDDSTPFPGEMQVDYVRVYRRTGGPGPVRPRGSGALPEGVVLPARP